LPKTVTRQRRDCDLNPGPSAPESSTLTTRLPSPAKMAELSFIWAPNYVLFLSSAVHCFYRKLLFIVCCTAFSIHICLFTRGAILLGIKSAPLSEDEDEDGEDEMLFGWQTCVYPRNRVLDVNAHSHHLANPMDCSVCPLQRCSLLQPGLRTDSTDFPDCLTILLSISILYFLVFLFFYYFSFWFHVVD